MSLRTLMALTWWHFTEDAFSRAFLPFMLCPFVVLLLPMVGHGAFSPGDDAEIGVTETASVVIRAAEDRLTPGAELECAGGWGTPNIHVVVSGTGPIDLADFDISYVLSPDFPTDRTLFRTHHSAALDEMDWAATACAQNLVVETLLRMEGFDEHEATRLRRGPQLTAHGWHPWLHRFIESSDDISLIDIASDWLAMALVVSCMVGTLLFGALVKTDLHFRIADIATTSTNPLHLTAARALASVGFTLWVAWAPLLCCLAIWWWGVGAFPHVPRLGAVLLLTCTSALTQSLFVGAVAGFSFIRPSRNPEVWATATPFILVVIISSIPASARPDPVLWAVGAMPLFTQAAVLMTLDSVPTTALWFATFYPLFFAIPLALLTARVYKIGPTLAPGMPFRDALRRLIAGG